MLPHAVVPPCMCPARRLSQKATRARRVSCPHFSTVISRRARFRFLSSLSTRGWRRHRCGASACRRRRRRRAIVHHHSWSGASVPRPTGHLGLRRLTRLSVAGSVDVSCVVRRNDVRSRASPLPSPPRRRRREGGARSSPRPSRCLTARAGRPLTVIAATRMALMESVGGHQMSRGGGRRVTDSGRRINRVNRRGG